MELRSFLYDSRFEDSGSRRDERLRDMKLVVIRDEPAHDGGSSSSFAAEILLRDGRINEFGEDR